MPEDGYHGEDIIEIGKQLAEEYGDKFVEIDEQERFEFFRQYGLKDEMDEVEKGLRGFPCYI